MKRTSRTQQWGPQHYEPAGLEVALPESGLEYHNPPFQEKFIYGNVSPRITAEVSEPENHGVGSNIQSGGCLPRTRRQRIVCLVVGILLVVIVVGASVGGTLASKRASATRADTDSPRATSTSSPIPSSTPTTTPPKSIKQNSALAVTAWRKVNGVEIYLFFQGPDNVVYRSMYDSASGPATANSSSLWQPPVAATTLAAPTSPLGATTIVFNQKFEPQIQLYHFSPPNNRLTGTNFNKQDEPNVGPDLVNGFNATSHSSSRMACYWPYTIYQDINNKYVEMRDDLDSFGTLGPTPGYTARSLGVLGTQGSRIGVVPLSTFLSTTARKGGYGVIGQVDGGDLIAFIPDEQQTTNVTRSWSTGANFPSINLPEGASFTAFATARPNDSNNDNRTNTYVLYQAGPDGSIGMAWRDDESSWKTSRPAALAGADAGTDIACLTMPESMMDGSGGVVLLEPASPETRCYFQRGGAVREVRLNGTDWVELGTVPLP